MLLAAALLLVATYFFVPWSSVGNVIGNRAVVDEHPLARAPRLVSVPTADAAVTRTVASIALPPLLLLFGSGVLAAGARTSRSDV
jgi:hypothetical protein